MSPFEPEAVYANTPYRVLPDGSIEAMMPGGLIKFKNIDQFLACTAGASAINLAPANLPYSAQPNADFRAESIPARSIDYHSLLTATIKKTEQNSAQLRALIYEHARFNFVRELMFGHSSINLTDLAWHMNEFEIAVARIEADVVEDRTSRTYPTAGCEITNVNTMRSTPEGTQSRESAGQHADVLAATTSNSVVQNLPTTRISPSTAERNLIRPWQRLENDRPLDNLLPQVRFANQLIGILVLGIIFIGTVIVAGLLWHSPNVASKVEAVNQLQKTGGATISETPSGGTHATRTADSSKLSYPLPTSYGIYALSENKLFELAPLPINVPDPRVALSAEIRKPTTAKISDHRPTFILFRRDLLTSAPQKLAIRVIARMARETKIVNGQAAVSTPVDAWRIRNISRELNVSPVPGHPEMIIARLKDDKPLSAGRYVLVLKRTGYDFTIKGGIQSPEFCLERFDTANGPVYTQCRNPQSISGSR